MNNYTKGAFLRSFLSYDSIESIKSIKHQGFSILVNSIMISETISQRADLIIRRHILEPGESLPWHTDECHRFSVIIRGEAIAIEYRDSKDFKKISVYPGLAEWDSPEQNVHRAINVGKVPFEEVIIFFTEKPNMEPQPGPE
ncbi:MAG TPA: hypothetical protein VFV08_05980 [Puia sp.]|nr:hypothetical protein [Puia sp.]